MSQTTTTTTQAPKVRTSIRAGGPEIQHNEAPKVRTSIRAGGPELQHNEAPKAR